LFANEPGLPDSLGLLEVDVAHVVMKRERKMGTRKGKEYTDMKKKKKRKRYGGGGGVMYELQSTAVEA
jgi:hypothetical protein